MHHLWNGHFCRCTAAKCPLHDIPLDWQKSLLHIFMTFNLVFLLSSYSLPVLASTSFSIFPSLLIITPRYFISSTGSISISPTLTSQCPFCLSTLITHSFFQFTFCSHLLSTSLIALRLLSSLSLESASYTMLPASRRTSCSPVDCFTSLVLFCLLCYFIYEHIK